MQNPSSEDEAKRSALQQRVDEHVAWKRQFFIARPPPPPCARRHRQHHERKGGAPLHVVFKRARELVEQEKLCTNKEEEKGGGWKATRTQSSLPIDAAKDAVVLGGHNRETSPTSSSNAVITSEEKAAADDEVANEEGRQKAEETLTKQERWVQQMRHERGRRNPFTDLHIRSDPRRTVIMADLHPDTVEEDVRVFADQFGRVVSVRVVRHRQTGRSRRYAFVEYGLPAEAKKATTFSRKKRLRGRAIVIDVERGRTEPGYLPKRLATAARLDPTVTSKATNSDSKAGTEGSVGSGLATSAPAAVDDDDDAFLQSILNP